MHAYFNIACVSRYASDVNLETFCCVGPPFTLIFFLHVENEHPLLCEAYTGDVCPPALAMPGARAQLPLTLSCSGSYDERVRIWDSRNLADPISTVPAGGGLWRLKWHPNPEESDLLLCACMHAGLRVLKTGLREEGGSVEERGEEIVARYTRHESMAYGADWCRLPESLRSPRPVVASCSFYDSLVCLWQCPLLQGRHCV